METKNIYQKLFEFKQKEITLSKDTKAYNYSYANLKQIQDKLSPILKELNLLVIHFNRWNEIVTQIRDLDTDTFVESFLEIWKVETTTTTVDDNKNKTVVEYNDKDPQWVGSALTYYRRYNLIELLDLEIEDDDWAKGSGRAKAKTDTTPKDIYTMTTKDVDEVWEWKIYWKSVYLNWEKKNISDEQITKLKAHAKYVELPPKK